MVGDVDGDPRCFYTHPDQAAYVEWVRPRRQAANRTAPSRNDMAI
jgi:hypothetical protein